jgi:hypothetical protein
MRRTQTTLSIAAATELWIQWALIGLEHRDGARGARERDGGPAVNNTELQASMIAIVAAASAINGFATIAYEAGVAPTSQAGGAPGRAVVAWDTLRANFEVAAYTQTWPRALKELMETAKRNGWRPGTSAHGRRRACSIPAVPASTGADDVHR